MCEATIEAVVFDVGRVLFQWDMRVLFARLVKDEARLERLLGEVLTEEWHFQHDQGRALDDMVPERIAEFPEFAEEIGAYRSRFNETIPGPVPGSLELVRKLHEAGMPLFAITNFGAEFWAGFAPQQPIFDLFTDIIVSGEEKIAKPDPAIFALAEKRFGRAPEHMLFIDDNRANIDSACALGWQVHHFSEANALKADLSKRGLL
ncbi:MAG: hydrolase [Citromicrobium sp.]|nr:MAG: hydrolase [Citromicrobium sp.]